MVFAIAGRAGDRVPGGTSGEDSAKETRKQKYDRRDARLELELLMEDRFPTIWMPSSE